MTHSTGAFASFPGAVFRHRRLLLTIFCTVVALTAIVTLLQKRQYRSEMKVAVQNTRETQAVSSDAEGNKQSQSISQDMLDSEINSEVELLTNGDLIDHLVQVRDTILKKPVPAAGSVEMAREAGALSKRLEVTPVRKSTLINVSYDDYTPEVAQAVLRALQQEYVKNHVRLRRPTGTSQFFADETTSVTDRLRQAQEKLSAFQAANGFVSLEKEKDLLAESLDKLNTSIQDDAAELKEASYESSELQRKLQDTKQRMDTSVKTVPNQYMAQQLIGELTTLRNKRIAMAQRFVPTDRLMVELDGQIKSTEDTLQYLMKNAAVEKTEDNDPAWMSMNLQHHDKQVTLAGISARWAEHRREAAESTTRLRHLQEITPENDALQAHVDELRRNQATLREKRDASVVDDMLDVHSFGNVAIALEPTLSRLAVKPARLTNAALGVLSAILLCAATLVVLESTRKVMLTPAELEASTGIPVLATLPDVPELAAMLNSGSHSTQNQPSRWLPTTV